MPVEIEAVTPKVVLGEGPFWDADSQCVYFVDVFKRYINKYSPSRNTYTKAEVPMPKESTISTITPIEGQKDQFLIGIGNELMRIRWNGVSDTIEKLGTIAELNEKEGYRWNDAKVDSSGRLWAGYFVADMSTGALVVPENSGGLYTLQPNGVLKERLQGLSMPNGLDWDRTGNSFYIIDSLANELLKFNYDPKSDEITNKEVIFHFKANGIEGVPDGMTIDENGNLWAATFGGRKIVNIDPRKPNTIIRTIEMPVNDITSVTFGGPNLDEMYVTSPSVAPMEGFKPLEGGYLYKITGLGVRGFPGRKVKL